MSDAILSRNHPTGKSMTRKNAVLGVLLALFVVIAFYYREQAGLVPGLFGFTPIVALALLTLAGMDIVLAVISAIIIAMIMTSTSLPTLGVMLANSTGSFIATVGLIIMLGAGVGEVAT